MKESRSNMFLDYQGLLLHTFIFAFMDWGFHVMNVKECFSEGDIEDLMSSFLDFVVPNNHLVQIVKFLNNL